MKAISSKHSVHSGGYAAFMEINRCDQRLLAEQKRLHLRLHRFCKPRGFIGSLLINARQRKLAAKLRARFQIPYAVFVH